VLPAPFLGVVNEAGTAFTFTATAADTDTATAAAAVGGGGGGGGAAVGCGVGAGGGRVDGSVGGEESFRALRERPGPRSNQRPVRSKGCRVRVHEFLSGAHIERPGLGSLQLQLGRGKGGLCFRRRAFQSCFRPRRRRCGCRFSFSCCCCCYGSCCRLLLLLLLLLRILTAMVTTTRPTTTSTSIVLPL